MKAKIEGVYLVTDPILIGNRSLEEVVLEAVKGGVTLVQLREKNATTREFIEKAQKIKRILEPFHVPLIINDRVDVALAVEADGIHVGQNDMPVELVRKLVGDKMFIGLSVETWEDVEKSRTLPVDYLGISPVFSTPTKTDTKGEWGLEGIKKIRAVTNLPLVAIGGINKSNAAEVTRAGADSIAVVSAICASENPKQAAKELHELFEKTYRQRND